MALTNEDLLAISQLLDAKLKPISDDTRNIKLHLENHMLPRLQNIESCYTSTARKYSGGISQIEAMQSDIDIIKKIVSEHSEKLKKIS